MWSGHRVDCRTFEKSTVVQELPLDRAYAIDESEMRQVLHIGCAQLGLHRYYENTQQETGSHSRKFVAMNLAMDRQIGETLAVWDMVRGRGRSPKQLSGGRAAMR